MSADSFDTIEFDPNMFLCGKTPSDVIDEILSVRNHLEHILSVNPIQETNISLDALSTLVCLYFGFARYISATTSIYTPEQYTSLANIQYGLMGGQEIIRESLRWDPDDLGVSREIRILIEKTLEACQLESLELFSQENM